MAISKESKQAIRQEIERYSEQKNIAVKEINNLKARLDKLKGRKDKLVSKLDKLKADINE